ncbi:SDR family oxidoreductase [Bordetella petrii]|uniref:SDR family oxidoreductase n=1 Tax=Bordetella petrii TaxID=94624 RepID=UPI001E40252A|nr:SDR family oxidoreductase [Bordetella petrii]MCD0504210.1 SDR family oxidoreductase [Bordetella petrii]
MQASHTPAGEKPVALVTGGSAGIGRAVIERLLQDGYEIVNFDLKPPPALLPGESHVAVDLCNADATREAVAVLAGQRDVLRLVNNAGTVRPALLEDATPDDLAFVMALNIQAPMLLMQGLLPAMRRRGFGRVVNIASRAALGKTERTVYAASKAGLLGMTRTWALEMGADGITVNAIGPGPIATELFERVNPPGAPQTERIRASIPVRRMGTPADVAHGVVTLLDDRAGFITGQVLYVCGGMTVGLGNAA